jgi:hypothetical protein
VQDNDVRQLVDAYRHQGVLVVFQREMAGVTYNEFRQEYNLPVNLTVRESVNLPAGASAALRNAVDAYVNRNHQQHH